MTKKFPLIIALLLLLSLPAAAEKEAFHLEGRTGGELYLFGGDYLGDEGANSWMAGGGYSYMFSETWGASLSYAYQYLEPVSGSALDRDLRSRNVHIITPSLVVNNPLVFKAGKSYIMSDIFLTIGLGPMKVNGYWEPDGMIGGGMRVYINKWLAFRVDVNSYIHPLRRSGKETINADLGIMGGFGILFPTKREPKKIIEECEPLPASAQ